MKVKIEDEEKMKAYKKKINDMILKVYVIKV